MFTSRTSWSCHSRTKLMMSPTFLFLFWQPNSSIAQLHWMFFALQFREWWAQIQQNRGGLLNPESRLHHLKVRTVMVSQLAWRCLCMYIYHEAWLCPCGGWKVVQETRGHQVLSPTDYVHFCFLNTKVLRKESCVSPGPCYGLHVVCPKESHSGSLFRKPSHL